MVQLRSEQVDEVSRSGQSSNVPSAGGEMWMASSSVHWRGGTASFVNAGSCVKSSRRKERVGDWLVFEWGDDHNRMVSAGVLKGL